MPPTWNVGDMVQFGFAAVMSLILLGALKDLIPKMLTVIADNSTAMNKMSETLAELTRSVERVHATTSDLNRRIDRLDDAERPKRIPVRG